MNIKEITNVYSKKAELHCHTSPISKCSHVTAPDMVALYAECGCDSVVVTNHLYGEYWMTGDIVKNADEYLLDYRIAKEEGEKRGVSVLLGVEIRFPGGHNDYLVYGVCEEDIKHFIGYLDKDISLFYKECKTDKNLILQAHPFRSGISLAPKESLDGIEVFNLHIDHNSRVALGAKYARENQMVISGGSDFHKADQAATCLIRTKERLEDSYQVAEVLKSADFLFDLSGNIVIPYNA